MAGGRRDARVVDYLSLFVYLTRLLGSTVRLYRRTRIASGLLLWLKAPMTRTVTGRWSDESGSERTDCSRALGCRLPGGRDHLSAGFASSMGPPVCLCWDHRLATDGIIRRGFHALGCAATVFAA